MTSDELPDGEAPRRSVERARALGADTDEVFDAAGIGDRARDELRRRGVI